MAIMMPMSWVLSLNYEATGSWNAKVELGSIQRREKCLSPLPRHSLPTFVNLAQMDMVCDQGLQQNMSSIYWPTSFQILEKDHNTRG